MIEFIRSYACTDGNVFAALERAQEHELILLLSPDIEASLQQSPVLVAAQAIVKNSDKVVDILTTTATSRPKARAIHGGKKPRKTTPPVNPANQP